MFVDYSINTGLFVDKSKYGLVGEVSIIGISVGVNQTEKILSSLNSQTLLEKKPEVKQLGFSTVIRSTGDYYVTGYKIKLDNELTGLSTKRFLYENTQTGSTIIFTTGNSGSLFTSFMRNLSSGISGYNYKPDVFLNGQKVYSGISYEKVNNTFVWIDDTNVNGKIFSYEHEKNNLELASSGGYDISGELFNKGVNKLYINGLQQENRAFLESCSVAPIDTGKLAIITGHNVFTQFEMSF